MEQITAEITPLEPAPTTVSFHIASAVTISWSSATDSEMLDCALNFGVPERDEVIITPLSDSPEQAVTPIQAEATPPTAETTSPSDVMTPQTTEQLNTAFASSPPTIDQPSQLEQLLQQHISIQHQIITQHQQMHAQLQAQQQQITALQATILRCQEENQQLQQEAAANAQAARQATQQKAPISPLELVEEVFKTDALLLAKGMVYLAAETDFASQVMRNISVSIFPPRENLPIGPEGQEIPALMKEWAAIIAAQAFQADDTATIAHLRANNTIETREVRR